MAQGRIVIGTRTYEPNPTVDRFQIHVDDLGDLTMAEIPRRSHLEFLGIPLPRNSHRCELSAVHSATEHEDGELSYYGGFDVDVPTDLRNRIVARLRRSFPEVEPRGAFPILPIPHIHWQKTPDGVLVRLFYSMDFSDRRAIRVRDAIAPFIDGINRFNRPSIHAFICHASEDKGAARELAAALKILGADVWFDEWEIRVGDSIVQKIDSALGIVSHLIVLLSETSISKPWVNKELSSALMRQLSKEAIMVLPVRLDGCRIPPILADLKYADARAGIPNIISEIETALYADLENDSGA